MRRLAAAVLLVGCYDPHGGGTPAGRCVDRLVVGAADRFACALTTDGNLWCWGDNTGGNLGDGTEINSAVPVEVRVVGSVSAASTSAKSGCAGTASQISCWGSNNFGQLGSGTTGGQDAVPGPVPTARVNGLRSIVAGDRTMCALYDDEVQCWGGNSEGQAGQAVSEAVAPSVVAGFPGVMAMGLGNIHACVLDDARKVWCWGSNSELQLAQSDPLLKGPEPVEVIGAWPGEVTILGVGQAHTCVAAGDAGVWCWGDNDGGQVGNGGSGVDVAVPAQVLEEPVKHLSGGEAAICAIDAGDSILCWGADNYGELGTGTVGDSHDTPLLADATLDLGPVRQVEIGYDAACAVTTANEVWCWGHNDAGQLGDGTFVDSPRPVQAQIPCP